MKSIMHEKNGTCYLCVKLCGDYTRYGYTEEHHVIFGQGRRKLSEKHGLKVYLCPGHHRNGKEAVHQNRKNRRMLEEAAQYAFERTHTRKEFMDIFGKNYLDEPEETGKAGQKECSRKEPGFRFL